MPFLNRSDKSLATLPMYRALWCQEEKLKRNLVLSVTASKAVWSFLCRSLLFPGWIWQWSYLVLH